MSQIERLIKAALDADSAVVRAAVIRGERLVAFVQPVTGGGPANPLHERTDRDRVFRERLRACLGGAAGLSAADAAVPIILVGSIFADSADGADVIALADRVKDFTESLSALTSIWAEVLGTPVIDTEVGFMAQGGDSLTAMRVSNRVRDRLGIKLPLPLLLSGQTAADIAASLVSDSLETLDVIPRNGE